MKHLSFHGIVSGVVLLCTVGGLLLGWKQDSVVHNRRVVTAVGLGGNDAWYQVSVQAVEALKTASNLAEQSENATAVYTAEGKTVTDAFQQFLKMSGNRAYVLQNQVLVISEELCRTRSLFAILDYFMRTSESNGSVKVMVFRGNPADLLSVPSGSEPIPATAVTHLIEEGNQWGLCFNTTLLDVERASSGMLDAALPLVEMRDDTPQLAGTVLFKNGQWAGILNSEKTTGLLAAGNWLRECVWETQGVAFRLESLKTVLHIQKQNETLCFSFSLSGKARLLEETAPIGSEQRQTCLQQVAEILQGKMADALQSADVYLSDPLGLARRAQQRYPAQPLLPIHEAKKQVAVSLSFADSGFFRS